MDDSQAPEIPGYTLGRLLGHGGTATVWLGTEQRTGRNYALKCFSPGADGAHASEGLSADAVKREVRILSVLDHQHLVKAHHVVRVGGGPVSGTALAMDYASGGSLARLVAVRGRLTVGETVTVLTPVAQALAYLHGKGFTHSDVSPGNVLFTGQGKPLLSDVGIARMLGDPGRAGTWGTTGFLDPAPVDAVRAGLQPERDVYALAALGWYCLTGEPPARTADRPPLALLVPEVPGELAAALEAGLNEDRRLRPAAAALGTAVYRSAPARPLDLAAAVHPTVIPELVTRRHVPAESAPSRFRGKRFVERMGTLQRRILTTRLPGTPWTKGRTADPKLPFPHTTAGGSGSGRHAGPGRGSTPGRHGPRAAKWPGAARLALAAVLVIAASWWLAGAAGSSPAGLSGGSAAGAAGTTQAETSQAAETGQPVDQEAAIDAARDWASAADPAEALAGLAALRDQAFSSGDLGLLDEVNAEGSPAAAADLQTGERLRSSGRVLSGFTSTLSGVAMEGGATPDRAVVRATSATSAYEEKDAQGTVVATGAATAGQSLRLVLVSVEGTWRISEILPGS